MSRLTHFVYYQWQQTIIFRLDGIAAVVDVDGCVERREKENETHLWSNRNYRVLVNRNACSGASSEIVSHVSSRFFDGTSTQHQHECMSR